jgi:hypothetical protein
MAPVYCKGTWLSECVMELLLAGDLFQVGDDFGALIGLYKLEGHVGVRNELVGAR